MTNSVTTNKLSNDGFRYVKKTAGTIIDTPRAESMMSCFRCGKFKLRNLLVSKRFLGKNMLVCAEKCTG
jgi:hypothetical protein